MRWVSTVALDAASSPRVGMVTESEHVRNIPASVLSESYPNDGPEIWFDDDPGR